MRILVISNLFPPRALGGYEILCGQVCAELAARGHQVVVLSSDGGPVLPGEPPVPDVRRVLRLTVPFGQPASLDRMRDLAVSILNARAARDAIRDARPDVAFVFSQLRLTLGAARAARDAGVPTLFTVNDGHLRAFVPGPFDGAAGLARRVLDGGPFRDLWLPSLRMDHLACISHRLRDTLAREGLPVAHARIVYQGIPIQRFPPKADPGSLHAPARLLYTGQLHPDKGVHTLVEAAGILARDGRDLVLDVAGDGPGDYPDRLRAMAAEHRAPATFLGRLPHEELPALYRNHDVFVFPSIWEEPFGLTHLEAMASGTPVASTADGGQAEFLEHDGNALVFPKGDAAALAAALARLLDDGALRTRLAREARAMVENRVPMRRYVDDLEALLAQVAGAAR